MGFPGVWKPPVPGGRACGDAGDGFRFHLRSRVKPTRAVLYLRTRGKRRTAKPGDYRPSAPASRCSPSLRRGGSREAKHQRSQPSPSAPKATPGARPRPWRRPGAWRRPASRPGPSTRKKAYMPPGGARHLDARQRRQPVDQQVAARHAGAAPGRHEVGRDAQRRQRAALHEHRRAGGVELDQLADRVEVARAAAPASRVASRSSGSSWRSCAPPPVGRRGAAMSRKLGAPRPSPNQMRS